MVTQMTGLGLTSHTLANSTRRAPLSATKILKLTGECFVLLKDDVNDLEPHRLQGETEAEDDVVGAGDPDGAVGLENAARLLQPPDVETVILRETHGSVPGAFVHRGEPAALDRDAASGEPVRWVGKDHVYAARGYDLHEIHTVREVHDGPRLAEHLKIPHFHTTIAGSGVRRL